MEPDEHAPPMRVITMNQVVAWNIAWYRRKAGLTQKELGARIGKSHLSLSEAERSWYDGSKVREFDAQDLAGYALALGVPVIALLLPPEDDGQRERYAIRPPGSDGKALGMGGMLAQVVLAPDHDDEDIIWEFRQRLTAAARRYLDPSWADSIARLASGAADPGIVADTIAALRGHAGSALTAYGTLTQLADALEAKEGGR